MITAVRWSSAIAAVLVLAAALLTVSLGAPWSRATEGLLIDTTQRSGFEWLYRLVTEPRRLWKRYLVNNPLFILGILGQKLGLRKYSL